MAESCETGLMAKGINLPGNSWNRTKFLLNPSHPYSHLVYGILIIDCGLIRHAPPGIDELNLAFLNVITHEVSHRLVSVPPPHIKESYLHY